MKRRLSQHHPTRDPERTQQRILAAALQEFSGKGLAGARVDAIARRAGVNKRMLYHYFGSKKGLFREVLHRKMAERATWAAGAPDDPMAIMPYWFDLMRNDTDWIRLLEWEALQQPSHRIVNEAERRQAFARTLERVERAQADGLLPEALDARQIVLSMTALITFPLAFPQLTRLITGRSATDPAFQHERAQFLSQLAVVLRVPGNSKGESGGPEEKEACNSF